jgi:hypothetical protein
VDERAIFSFFLSSADLPCACALSLWLQFSSSYADATIDVPNTRTSFFQTDIDDDDISKPASFKDSSPAHASSASSAQAPRTLDGTPNTSEAIEVPRSVEEEEPDMF